MNTVRLNAYAKLNLTLDLTGKKDGYHLLDSLVCTVDLSDRIVIKKRKDRLVSVTMHGMGSESIAPESNQAQKAGEAFVEAFNTTGADITVFKNIPIGAGMGGSSADAAGVLQGMARMYKLSDTGALKQLADSLGSDTGYLLSGGFARMQGRGELLTPMGACPRLHFFVIFPKVGVSTAECYRAADTYSWTGGRTEEAIPLLRSSDLYAFGAKLGNDLYAAATTLQPAVERALQEANSFSPLGASMTGSGSAVFALFETEELCRWAQSRYRGKSRTYVLKTVVPKEKKGFKNPFSIEEG